MEKEDVKSAGQLDGVAVSETVSCKKCVDNLQLKLIPQRTDDDLRVISISDSEAVGKTALARSVYSRLEVRRCFGYRAWICVQNNSSVRDVLANILRQISTNDLKDVDLADEIELSGRLHEYFFKQSYLIVLDNMNNVNLAAKLVRLLLDYRNGSRVIITTRNVDLPNLIDPWAVHIEFHPLTRETREQLLLQSLKERQSEARLLSRCNLSPAGIRLLGALLSMMPESGKFEEMIGRLAEKENPSLGDDDIVSLCYDELGREIQDCVMYVCQFPREFEIPTRRLLRLWLAHSFLWKEEPMPPASWTETHLLEPNRGIKDAENVFEELVRSNMIHVVSRGKGHGFAKTCRMPGFIYDFLLQKASETGFFKTYSNDRLGGSSETQEQSRDIVKELRSYTSFNTRKIRMQKGEQDDFLNPKAEKSNFVAPRQILVDKPSINDRPGGSSEIQGRSDDQRQCDLKQLCSYMSFNTKKNTTQKKSTSSLEVLDLEGVYKPVLPKDLGKLLLNLKYLGLRWTILDELPKSVGDLPYLETLDVKHTNITKVPSSIWRKKSLRHLYLNEVSTDKSVPQRWRLSPSSQVPKVNNLQTLCGVRCEAKSPILEVLSKLTGIKKLSLTCPSTVVKDVMNHIKDRTTLQSLKLKSKDLLGQPSEILLENTGGFKSLSNLYLFGNIQGDHLKFLPKSLKSLTLSMSFLGTIPMNEFQTLEHLTDLRLYGHSYHGTALEFSNKMFPELRTLKMWKLDKLKSLIVKGEAMPCLEELDIRDCQALGEISLLGKREALKEISLAKVKEETAKTLKAGSLGRSIIITTKLIPSATAAKGLEAN